MSGKNDGPVLSLKVFMDKQKSKVIFAEANGQFLDALIAFLTLPLGRILKIWEDNYNNETPVFGSLYNLRRSFKDKSPMYLSGGCGDSIKLFETPVSSLVNELAEITLDISQSFPAKYCFCENSTCAEPPVNNVRIQYGNICDSNDVACDCGWDLTRVEFLINNISCDMDALTKKELSIIIFDHLRVVPNVNGFLQTLRNFGIADLNAVEIETLDFKISDMTNLFKLALISDTPLTDYAIKKTVVNISIDPVFFHLPEEDPDPDRFSKTTLKVFLEIGTGKFLFAVADCDFVAFLLSLLAIPVGGVEFLFGGETAFKSLDNLYASVRDEIDYSYFANQRVKDMIINPKLPYGYNFRGHQFLIHTEQTSQIYFRKEDDVIWLDRDEKRGVLVSFKSSGASCVKDKVICLVSDDLSVTPYSIASIVSLLQSMEIPLSDVVEKEFPIGFNEALSILKASLTSNTVFTDALINPMFVNMNLSP